MKKLLLATLLIGMMGGSTTYSTKEIDGCEYIETYSHGSHTSTLTHKGNCSNPIHKGGK
jgi:fluoride ion exporter CrcB/FEX